MQILFKSDKSLNLIAEESNGGLRDAVSMLDQLNAYADGNIKYEDVLLLNGRINDDIDTIYGGRLRWQDDLIYFN